MIQAPSDFYPLLAQQLVAVSLQQQQQLAHYVDRLAKWSKIYNLVSANELPNIYQKHIADSLVVAPWMGQGNVIDIGTGAGFPGIPLAIISPEQQFTLLDSSGKKTRFLTQVVSELALKNIRIVNQRVENYRSGELFSAIICRAFSSMQAMIQLSAHLLRSDGRYYFMKSQHVEQELTELPAHMQYELIKLDVPQLNAIRYLVSIAVEDRYFNKCLIP